MHVFSHWQRLFLASKWWLQIFILYTSCKTSYNVLSHSHWGLGQFVRGGPWNSEGVVKKREYPDVRSPKIGISVLCVHLYIWAGTRTSFSLVCVELNLFFWKTIWESDISEHYPGNTLMREEWVTSVDKGSHNNEACLYLMLTRVHQFVNVYLTNTPSIQFITTKNLCATVPLFHHTSIWLWQFVPLFHCSTTLNTNTVTMNHCYTLPPYLTITVKWCHCSTAFLRPLWHCAIVPLSHHT